MIIIKFEELKNEIDKLSNDELNIIFNLISLKRYQSVNEYDFIKLKWKNGIYCLWCKSTVFKKNGLYNNVQRYLCKNCKRTFNYKTNTFLSWTHLTIEQWIEYLRCFLLQLTCKATKEFAKLSIWSVWKNRIKLLKHLWKNSKNHTLSGTVWLDETFINETYKGNWKEENKYHRLKLRQNYAKTHGLKLRGVSRFKLNIVSGTNTFNENFFEPTCFGKLNKKAAFQVLDEHLGKNIDLLITDMEQSYFSYAQQNNLNHQAIKSTSKNNNKLMSTMNHLHSRFKHFIRKFKGISVIYSILYFIWFKFLDEYRKLPITDQKNILLQKIY